MQTVNFHLAYLLTTHECVIIPGFGAFITFSSQAKKEERSGMWHAPRQGVGFNSTINHNDGLLANSIAKEKNTSYKEASIYIKQYVDRLQQSLASGETITIPWVGSFSFSSNKNLEFKPALELSCNLANVGFSNFYFPSLDEIEKERKQPEEEITIPRIRTNTYIKRVCATAAAVVALFVVTIPIGDYSHSGLQNASILPMPSITNEVAAPEKEISEAAIFAIPQEEPKKEIAPVNIRRYYIVVSSLPSRSSAEERALEFKEQMLFEAGVISSEDKHRVYARCFEDKTEAEAFLLDFRKAYPQHSNAWLLSQKG